MAGKYKPFGVDLDPSGELNEKIRPDGDVDGYIRGEKVNYDEIINELEERTTRAGQGKPAAKPKMYFGGYGAGTNRKAWESDEDYARRIKEI